MGGRRCAVPGRGPRPSTTAQRRGPRRPKPARHPSRAATICRPTCSTSPAGKRSPRWSRNCCAPLARPRSTAWPAWAKPASPYASPIGSPRRTRTAGSTSTCTASPRARSRWSRTPRWAGCWARWTSRIPRSAPPNARRSGGRSCPAGGPSSCSTTPPTRTRCARCSPAQGSPRSWSPAATGWSVCTGCRRCPWSHWPTPTRRTCSVGRPGSR